MRKNYSQPYWKQNLNYSTGYILILLKIFLACDGVFLFSDWETFFSSCHFYLSGLKTMRRVCSWPSSVIYRWLLMRCVNVVPRWTSLMTTVTAPCGWLWKQGRRTSHQYWWGDVHTVQCCYNAVNFLRYPYNRHPIARPGIGVCVVSLKPDLCSATVLAVPYVISWKIGLHYNGTRLW